MLAHTRFSLSPSRPKQTSCMVPHSGPDVGLEWGFHSKNMKILITQSFVEAPSTAYYDGDIVEVSDSRAEELIDANWAVPLDDEDDDDDETAYADPATKPNAERANRFRPKKKHRR